MKFHKRVGQIFANKVLLYLFSRYFTYFIQFATSIIIAIKLGPYYFGIWGFLLLLINYFQISNLGIANSMNVLLVQYKMDNSRIRNFTKTSYLIIGAMGFVVLLIALYYFLFGIPIFDKYEVNSLFYIVCVIAILAYFNKILMTIYRVKNSLIEIAFFQSIIPILVFIAIFLAKERNLLIILLSVYIIGHLLSLSIFLTGKILPRGGRANLNDAKEILSKGFYLFLYNLAFYLIIISIRTIVSIYYSVEEFGLFTFSYTLANSVLLFLEAMAFVIFPKIIDKLNTDKVDVVESILTKIRQNYVSTAHGLIYIALIFFPVILKFTPKYSETIVTLNLIALTVVLYTNSFGYNSYLIARNKEKTVAIASIIGLIINIFIALILINGFHISYEYVIIATMISYIIYTYLCVYFGKKHLKLKTRFYYVLKDSFPLNLLVPYISAVIIVTFFSNLIFIPLIIYIFLNINTLKKVFKTILKIIENPEFINLRI